MNASRFHSILQTTSAWSRDTVSLMKSLYQAWHNNPKPLTLMLADHRDNPVALQLLSVHKEYNLLRYYGIRGYVKQRRNSSNIEGECDQSSQQSLSTSSSPTVARVSFMVTARMKEELGALGYSLESISKLNPTEASLILQHQLKPITETSAPPAETLSALVKEHEEQAALYLQQQQQKQQQQADQASTDAYSQQQSAGPRQQSPRSSLFANYASQNELSRRGTSAASSNTATKQTRVWYELVGRFERHNNDDTDDKAGDKTGTQEEILGLYQSEKEAQDGLETHQYFAQRDQRAMSFEIRQTTR